MTAQDFWCKALPLEEQTGREASPTGRSLNWSAGVRAGRIPRPAWVSAGSGRRPRIEPSAANLL